MQQVGDSASVAPSGNQHRPHLHAHRHSHSHSHSHSLGANPGPFSSAAPSSGAAVAPVRLPPVSLPPADFLEAPGFNPGRRQSVNSDPFLHAFSGTQHSSAPHAGPSDSYGHAQGHGRRDDPSAPHSHQSSAGTAMSMEILRPPSTRDHQHMHDARFSHASGSGAPGHEPYDYTAQYGQQHHPGLPFDHAPVGPASTYRFGGPHPTSSGPPPPVQDGPSYSDYSMSRHTVSNNGHGNESPDRIQPTLSQQQQQQPPVPSHLSRQTESHHQQSPTPSLKRKTSDDSAVREDGFGTGPSNSPFLRGPPPVGAAPHPKRRTSSLTYEKLNNLSLAEQQRRDSSYGPMSPWEEERRGSDESYASHSSHGYPVPAYQHMHAGAGGYDQRGSPYPPSSAPPQHPMGPGPAWDGQQVGPRGSIARAMYSDEGSQFARRPSIPSVSQMMQGQQPFYPVGAPHPVHSPHPGPPPSWPPTNTHGPPQPSVMISSETPTPANELDDPHSRPPTSASYHPASQHAPSGPPSGPPAPWTRGGPPVPPPGLHISRHNSSSSVNLDPSSAYPPGQGPPSKDSPYSRSPELRVSHKLAERKRRKEMAQLFEDLREQLPFDRGLKASKWEILSKAVDYINSLKSFTEELVNDNRALREHFNLPPGPTAPPPELMSSQDDPGRGAMDSSNSSQLGGTSHEASPAPVSVKGPAGLDASQVGANSNVSPSQSRQNLAPLSELPGQMPPPQWQQPQRPSSRTSYAGQLSPALGTATSKQQQRVVSGGMAPQPSPTLSQHSGPLSPSLGTAHSTVPRNDGAPNGGDPLNGER